MAEPPRETASAPGLPSRRRRIRSQPPPAGAPARVTIVIPCYNYARYLPDSVGSALAQNGVDLDVVIVDDASTDASVEVAREFATKDPRVRLVRHTQNRGHVETSNEALHLATGEYIVKLDADDLLTPGSLARSAALLQANPDVVFCYGYPQRFRGDPPTGTPTAVRSWTLWNGWDWIAQVLRRAHNVIMQPEVMLRRSAVVATGGYRPQLRWAEDYNWWLRLAAAGSVGRVDGPTQGLYRWHEASFQRSAEDVELSDLRARIAAVDLFFDELGEGDSNITRLRGAALRALARDARRLAASAGERLDGGVAAEAEYIRLAHDLDARSGASPARSLSGSRTAIGHAYRDLAGRVNWRRWRRYGI